jgi:hypothetical protein
MFARIPRNLHPSWRAAIHPGHAYAHRRVLRARLGIRDVEDLGVQRVGIVDDCELLDAGQVELPKSQAAAVGRPAKSVTHVELFFIHPVGAAVCLAGSDELDQRLKRIFNSPAFAAKRYGPARWIRGGAAYTTVEDAPGAAGAKDIVEYDTATGKRTILVSHTQLTPPKAEKPLTVEDYRWDKDASRLLIYTASKKVWRTNSRGDYWVLDRATGALKKLGGDAPASSLSFAKFSPDGGRAAYVRANNLYVEDLATGAIRALSSDGSDTLVHAGKTQVLCRCMRMGTW